MSVSRKGAKFGPKIIKKMDGNDRFPIDFPCVSIKGSQLPVYTKFLHSIDISICSCYGLNAIFNGSRLSCMVQWLPVNILNCQPHKKTFSGYSVTMTALRRSVAAFYFSLWWMTKNIAKSMFAPKKSCFKCTKHVLRMSPFWPLQSFKACTLMYYIASRN